MLRRIWTVIKWVIAIYVAFAILTAVEVAIVHGGGIHP